MTTKPTIDGVPRTLIERAEYLLNTFGDTQTGAEMRGLLSTPMAKPQRNPEGKRERFQKWVLAKKHPVFGFLDGRSLARSDDRTGYADEYVQGLWVAYLEFGVDQPAPVAITPAPNTYMTKPGESIAGIAARELKDESRWTEIRDLNADIHPSMGESDYYPVGTLLVMPAPKP